MWQRKEQATLWKLIIDIKQYLKLSFDPKVEY